MLLQEAAAREFLQPFLTPRACISQHFQPFHPYREMTSYAEHLPSHD